MAAGARVMMARYRDIARRPHWQPQRAGIVM